MPTLLWQRDFETDADNVRNTFSSWDSCMAESYCKWPAIVGIIIGSLIVISIIWCCARCLCCGLECCCGICSCCNRCCPSPRRSKEGYQKPETYPYNSQYQSPAPPMYFGGGYRAPQTATFDAPSGKIHEDSLPAMPTWSTAPSKQVEQDDVAMEMEKLYPSTRQGQQSQRLLNHQRNESDDTTDQHGDLGAMHADDYHQQGYKPYSEQAPSPYPGATSYQAQNQYRAESPYQAQSPYRTQSPYQQQSPYHDYSQHQQVASPTSTAAPSMYPPTYHTRPPSSVYTSPYAAPPSYQTAPPSIISPAPQHAQTGSYGVGRNPVSGSWRDV